MQTLVERLRTDFGKKTLGDLLQEREAAAHEIERLMREIAAMRCAPKLPRAQPRPVNATNPRSSPVAGIDGRELLRLAEVCKLLGLSRSTIYAAVANGKFPRAVRIGVRAVRWRSADVSTWLASKSINSG